MAELLTKKQKGVIEISTFSFCDTLPKNGRILLSKCNLPLKESVPGYFSGLQGYAIKNEAMMHARQYAEQRGLYMIVVNMYLKMLHPLTPGYITEESLPNRSLLATARLSGPMIRILADHWKEYLVKHRNYAKHHIDAIYDWSKPESFIADHPRFVGGLFGMWPTIQVISHPARFTFLEKATTVATFLPTEDIFAGLEIDVSSRNLVSEVVNDLI